MLVLVLKTIEVSLHFLNVAFELIDFVQLLAVLILNVRIVCNLPVSLTTVVSGLVYERFKLSF